MVSHKLKKSKKKTLKIPNSIAREAREKILRKINLDTFLKCNSVTVTFKIHFEKCNRLQLHEVTFQKNVTGYGYMKLLFKKM